MNPIARWKTPLKAVTSPRTACNSYKPSPMNCHVKVSYQSKRPVNVYRPLFSPMSARQMYSTTCIVIAHHSDSALRWKHKPRYRNLCHCIHSATYCDCGLHSHPLSNNLFINCKWLPTHSLTATTLFQKHDLGNKPTQNQQTKQSGL